MKIRKYLKFTPIIVFIIFSTITVFITPVFEAPDEAQHVDYINYISTQRKLPNQLSTKDSVLEGHQQPLYYAISSLIVRLINQDDKINITLPTNPGFLYTNGETRGGVPAYYHEKIIDSSIFFSKPDMVSFYILRLFSVFLGATTILFLMKTIEILMDDTTWNFFSLLFLATLPQFIFISSVINNDSLLISLSSITIFEIIKSYKNKDNSTKRCITIGGLIGLACLTKISALFLIPPAILSFILIHLKLKERTSLFIQKIAISLFTLIFVCGWSFLRNTITYGDPFASKLLAMTLVDYHPNSLFSIYFINPFLPVSFISFIGDMGSMTILLPKQIYITYATLLTLSFIGIYIFIKTKKNECDQLILPITLCVFSFLGLVYYNLSFPQPQGRYLFPSIVAFSTIVTIGLKEVLSRMSKKHSKLFLSIITLFFLTASTISIYTTHKYYSNPQIYCKIQQ